MGPFAKLCPSSKEFQLSLLNPPPSVKEVKAIKEFSPPSSLGITDSVLYPFPLQVVLILSSIMIINLLSSLGLNK